MRSLRIAAAGALVAVCFTASPAQAKAVSLVANLSATEEVPNPGPAGAMGTATVNINTDTNQVCYKLAPTGLSETPSAGHIHEGAKGVAGPVAIDFNLPANGLEACVAGDAAKVAAIVANPANFYVNIHTPSFQAGAIRGQLAEIAIAAPPAATQPATQPAPAQSLPRTGFNWVMA